MRALQPFFVHASFLIAGVLLVGCGDDSDALPDGSIPVDASMSDADPVDASMDALVDAPSSDAIGDTGSTDAGPPVGEWTIPGENRVGQKLAMYAVYPRPDDESSPEAYHRKAHTQMRYRVIMGIQGGEWPFRYELLNGPEGASFVAGELARRMDAATGGIVHDPQTPGYGVVEWDPVPGTHSFQLRVTDQSGATLDVEWEVVTDDAAFVFIDSAGGDDGNTGDFDSPLQTFEALWNDPTFAGRVAVFREGRYEVLGTTDSPSPALDQGVSPGAMIGHAGESVIFDMSRGHFRTSSRIDDVVVAGIDFVGSRTDLPNNRLFNIGAQARRATFWECSFDDNTAGTDPRDNPTGIGFYDVGYSADGGLRHENLAILGCSLGENAQSQLVVTFSSNHVLMEGNRAGSVDLPSSNGSFFLHPKDDTSNITVRNNVFSGNLTSAVIAVGNQNAVAAENQEVCWNTILYAGNRNVDAAISFNMNTGTPDGFNTYVYRNTVLTPRRAFRFGGATVVADRDPVSLEANAYYAGFEGIAGGNHTETANVELAESDFDAEGRLVDVARSTHAGLAGAEIVGR